MAPPAHPSYSGPEEVLGKIFANEAPIVWVRVHEFQLESLKAIALRILRHCVRYMSCGTSLQRPVTIDRTISQGQSLLVGGVNVPGEVGPYRFSGPITILVCHGNEGAFNVAEEVRAAAHEGRTDARTDAAGPRTVMIREAEGVLDDAPAGTDAVLLLYLTNRTFLDEGGTVARLVQTAMDRRVPIALVAEQDPGRGGCPFRLCMQQTPQMLQQPPYKLFDTVAVPLYSSPEHRKVSLRHVLRSMGAAPCDAAALTRCLRICRRHILEAPIAIPGKNSFIAAKQTLSTAAERWTARTGPTASRSRSPSSASPRPSSV